MDKIQLENLRCFKNTGEIELKPLTIAVGKNSSGKSTLARVFPLFKQTLETKLSEPILWYGRYVDFGGYNESKSKFQPDSDTICFSFDFSTTINYFDKELAYGFLPFMIKPNEKASVKMKIKIYIEKDEIKKIYINVFGVETEIAFNRNTNFAVLNINNKYTKKFKIGNDDEFGNIIPKINSDNNEFVYLLMRALINYEKSLEKTLLKDELISLLIKVFDRCKVPDENHFYAISTYEYLLKNELNFELKYKNIEAFLSKAKHQGISLIFDVTNYKKLNKKTISDILEEIKLHKEQISIYIIKTLMPDVIDACNAYLSNYFKNVKYIAPVRATAERYYRRQGLNIQEVDARGENVPMILQSMSRKELSQFNNWLHDNFGFEITTKIIEEHVSVKLLNDNIETNIADAGFGYSQILPIILILWKNIHKKNSDEVQIVIEQPELHLHPKMQVQLLKVILNVISHNKNIKFFLETHSETIINQIGFQIESKNISPDSINVLLIEQPTGLESCIRHVAFNKDGYLEEWPIDFFEEA